MGGLTDGDHYTFTVTATNGAGTGPASSASKSGSAGEPGQRHVGPSGVAGAGGHLGPGQDPREWIRRLLHGEDRRERDGGCSRQGGEPNDTITGKVTVGGTAAIGLMNVTVSDDLGSATCVGCLTIQLGPHSGPGVACNTTVITGTSTTLGHCTSLVSASYDGSYSTAAAGPTALSNGGTFTWSAGSATTTIGDVQLTAQPYYCGGRRDFGPAYTMTGTVTGSSGQPGAPQVGEPVSALLCRTRVPGPSRAR